MRYLSVCSGIEAATVAWHDLGWEPAGFSEIEKFPSQVLNHHYPKVQNFGDMTKFEEWNLDSVGLLVGGTPCQSFSVAGLRKGLDDPRGNLMLTYGAIAKRFRPKWLVWENVPGVLSSNGGRDFGTFLGMLGELGYGFAYRVLDAQYFGVAQRRKRVFVVGCLGDWRTAAAVLFERDSLCGNPAPSREKGKNFAAYAESSLAQYRQDEIGGTLKASGGCLAGGSETFVTWPSEICSTLNANFGSKLGDVHGVAQPIPFDTTQITSKANYSNPQSGDPCHPLAAGAHIPAIAQSVAFNVACGKGELKDDIHVTDGAVTKTLDAFGSNPATHQGGSAILQPVLQAMAVRRLTPVECERLQGFPDNYTNIRDKCPDGPRYKALGNSMAVPVMRWIGQRIKMVEEL